LFARILPPKEIPARPIVDVEFPFVMPALVEETETDFEEPELAESDEAELGEFDELVELPKLDELATGGTTTEGA